MAKKLNKKSKSISKVPKQKPKTKVKPLAKPVIKKKTLAIKTTKKKEVTKKIPINTKAPTTKEKNTPQKVIKKEIKVSHKKQDNAQNKTKQTIKDKKPPIKVLAKDEKTSKKTKTPQIIIPPTKQIDPELFEPNLDNIEDHLETILQPKEEDTHKETVCREIACDHLATTTGYCRLHYIKNWKKIKRKEIILREKKLDRYIHELVNKYPEKYIEAIRQDLSSNEDFAKVISDLDLKEGIDDFGIDDDSENFINSLRKEFEEDEEF